VPVHNSLIQQWAVRPGKLAAYAVRALALLGGDAALTTIVALAIRYRTENKNMGNAAVEACAEAAIRLRITPDELGDRAVPWLGFEPDMPRVSNDGGQQIEASIGPDFKLTFRVLAKISGHQAEEAPAAEESRALGKDWEIAPVGVEPTTSRL
jgi:hypothetical protein